MINLQRAKWNVLMGLKESSLIIRPGNALVHLTSYITNKEKQIKSYIKKKKIIGLINE